MRGLTILGCRIRVAPVPLRPDLARAYENADYVVFGEPPIVLRIGKTSPELDALLQKAGKAGAAFITAANPLGMPTDAATNQAAVQALLESLAGTDFTCYGGEGCDPDHLWTPEPSLLVVGIGRADAQALGRRLRQNALVFIEKGKAAELVVLS